MEKFRVDACGREQSVGFSVRNSGKSRSRQTYAAGAADVDDREDDESGSFEFFGLIGPEDHTRDENKKRNQDSAHDCRQSCDEARGAGIANNRKSAEQGNGYGD